MFHEKPTNEELADALYNLHASYARGVKLSKMQFDRYSMIIARDVTGYAMAQFVARLIDEGYVREERRKELGSRARNLQAGDGFLTDEELAAKTKEQSNELDELFS